MKPSNEKDNFEEKTIHQTKMYENEIEYESKNNNNSNLKPINNMEDYTEIIPQKIENKQNSKHMSEKKNNEKLEGNYDNQNLDFSFGKDLQQENLQNNNNNKDNKDINNSEKTDANTNTNSNSIRFRLNGIFGKRDAFSDNLSSYQLTESLSNLRDNISTEENKKMEIIKEKFLSNFKNKDRGESLEKALTLFEKYQNLGKINFNNILNQYSSNMKDFPYKHLISQSTNSLSFNDNASKFKKIVDNKKSFNNLKIDYINKNNESIIKNVKKNNNLNNMNKMKYNTINNNKKNNSKNNSNKKLIIKKLINRKKGHDKFFILKDDKKKGFYIRKVVREEKYYVDDNGKENLIGIKQSTFDTKENNENKNIINKEKTPNINLKYKNKQLSLLDKKKLAQFIKEKISHKKSNNSASLQNKNQIGNNIIKNKNIEIKTDFINNKEIINNDNCNNIKIVINKINKINTNPKINLNFIKKYNNKKEKERDNITDNKLNVNERDNLAYQTEKSGFKTFHLVKVDKLTNSKNDEYKPIITNYSINSYKNDEKQKLKGNYKILKSEKYDKVNNKTLSNKFITSSNISIYASNPSILIQKRNKWNKRNYSYKETKNLSNGINSKNYKFNNNKRNNDKSLTIETSYYANNNNKFKKIPINKNFQHKNRPNHIFFESKSFSNKKIDNQKFNNSVKYMENSQKNNKYNNLKIFRFYNNYNNSQLEDLDDYEYKTIKANNNLYYSNGINNSFNFNSNETNWKDKNILGKNVYRINASFNNNVYCSNFTEYNNLNIHY